MSQWLLKGRHQILKWMEQSIPMIIELDLSLIVILPLTSNLPILSVLLGTSPQIAGIIYVADKLVGKKVAQLAGIRYRLHGSFEKPSMTLDKLFSNQPKKKTIKYKNN